MRTLNYPKRAMRPHPANDRFVPNCGWCNQPIGRGVPFSVGVDLGKETIVCRTCLTPPALGEFVVELIESKE
jgi:hypothetical protein